MALSNLEKVLLAKLGIDVARTPLGRAAAMQVARMIAPVTVPVSNAAGAALTSPLAGVAAGTYLGTQALQTEPGQDLLAAAAERGRMDRIRFEQALTDLKEVKIPKTKKRAKTRFQKMVSAGMKTIKASKSYGKKGVIKDSKKAFKLATTTASKVLKGKTTGGAVTIRGRIARAMRKIR